MHSILYMYPIYMCYMLISIRHNMLIIFNIFVLNSTLMLYKGYVLKGRKMKNKKLPIAWKYMTCPRRL